MYGNWFDNAKPKYEDSAKLSHLDKDNLIANIKSEDVYADLVVDVGTRFDISNYEVDRPLPIVTNNKVIGLMKDKFCGRTIKEFVAFNERCIII